MSITRRRRCTPALLTTLAAILVVAAPGASRAAAPFIVTEIIDANGDGAGNSLSEPVGIAVDAAGNIYIAGNNSNNAFKITPAGVITEIIDATGDGAGNGLDGASGIAVDAAGNAYVTGFISDNAFKITPAGLITEIIDATGDGAGNGLGSVLGIAVDAVGNAYVTGQFTANAFKITPAGGITEIIDSTGDGAGNHLRRTSAIAVDAAGDVYVTGLGTDNAFKITPAGLITEIIDLTGDGAGNQLLSPIGIAVDAGGNVYVTGSVSDNAFKITPAGVTTQIIDMTGDGLGNGLSQSRSIALDAAGNVYVTGSVSDNAFKITPAGVIKEIIDCIGDGLGGNCPGVGNGLGRPLGIAVDTPGNIYVTGFDSDNAFKVTPFGLQDCNDNGIPDETDIADGTSQDGNANGIPDECEPDCNNNGKDDTCDINCSNPNGPCDFFNCGASQDCNGNGIPDECDLDPLDPDGNGQVSLDCNANDIPDDCEPDCNNNSIPDECDLDPLDPDGNGQVSLDCNANDIPDECELAGNDCNASGIPDECELAGNDCNADGIHDDCEPDCNGNGKSDTCEILDGTTSDCNANGIPDDCDLLSITQRAKLTAADGAAFDFFGQSVAISGDTAVIGAIRDDDACPANNGCNSGSAYVFVRSGGVWTQQAKLTAADAAITDFFGESVSISGDTAVIGSRLDDDGGDASGSAYVFVRSGGVWAQQAKLTADDGAGFDEFGNSVSISGDTAVIGSRFDDDAGSQSGSAYVFIRSGGLWTQAAKLTADDGAGFDEFGNSVSISGDTAVIGAHRDGDAGSRSGSAYVFVRTGGVWTQHAKLTAADAATGDEFGNSVSVSSDTAVIGAHWDDDAGGGSGSAYVFIRSGGLWTQAAKLTADDGAGFDEFGNSVSISGDTAVIGAHRDDDAGVRSGSAYVFIRSGGLWTQAAKLTADDGAAVDEFGFSVSISGETALIGAHWDDDAGTNSGSAYVFTPSSDCNANGVPDECELAGNDCNADGIHDDCEPDCNGNATPDPCEILDGTTSDCNLNGIPDECEPDCNGNGTPDPCEILDGTASDCNLSGIPDECELAGNDCNTNGIPDECEPDCNGNGTPDPCEILDGTANDCNLSGIPDACELVGNDCNVNGIPDECDAAGGVSQDCNSNGIPDECEGMPTILIYDIALGDLINVPNDCGNGPFNDCISETGFSWLDTGTGSVVAVRIEANIGLNCHAAGTILDASLNAIADQSFILPELNHCTCALTPGIQVGIDANPANYNLGAVNTFLITNPTACLGYTPQAAWGDGVFARVTVQYGRDCNTNGIPDLCETCGDLDGDGDVDAADFTLFLGAFSLGVGAVGFEPCADFDGDGVITLVDFQQWLQCYRSFIGSPLAPPPTPENVGDMDDSGAVDGNDIQPFVDALLHPAAAGFRARFMADANGDGAVDSADVGEFVGLLLSQS